MSHSVASSRVGGRSRKIAPELSNSPYLAGVKPVGFGSPGQKAKARRKRGGGGSDAASVASQSIRKSDASVSSFRSHRTHRSSFQSSSRHNASRMASMKQLLLPRETDKLLRGFRQKHKDLAKGQEEAREEVDDGCSTIASDDCASFDDKAVYLECRKDEDVAEALFSGPLFAELALQTCDRSVVGPKLHLPPIGTIADDGDGDVSDLESLQSNRQPIKRR
ncbi:hypothetical protein ACHAXT_007480 [Thalassiosira profunda]